MEENTKKDLIFSMASFINAQDIDEFLCKKVKCRRYDVNGIDNGDYYDCIDCIIDFFKTPCKWKADNDVCVNADCEHCADFVSGVQCGKCYLKEIQ
jgi:hypothetical protein